MVSNYLFFIEIIKDRNKFADRVLLPVDATNTT